MTGTVGWSRGWLPDSLSVLLSTQVCNASTAADFVRQLFSALLLNYHIKTASIFYLYMLFLNPPSTSYFISLCVSVEINTLIRKYTLIFFPHYLYLTIIHHLPYILTCSNILLSLYRIVQCQELF